MTFRTGAESRHLVFAGIAALLVLTGCESLRFTAAELARGVPTSAPPPPLEEAWTYNAGAAFGPDAAFALGELAFVTTRQGEVHAVDLERGKKRGVRAFGDVIEGGVAVDRQTLFVPIASGRYAIAAYNLLDGRLQWERKGAPVTAGAVVTEGRVVVADLSGTVRAFEVQRGEDAWTYELPEDASVQATPLVTDGGVLVAAADGRMRHLGAEDGRELWSASVGAPVYNTPALVPMRSGGALAIVPTTRGTLSAFDMAGGSHRWSYALPDTTVRFASPAYADGLVLAPATDGSVYALDAATGALAWTYHADDVFTAAPLVQGGYVYLGTMRGHVLVLSTRGEEVARYDVRGRVKSAVLAYGGGLLVLSEPRHLTYFVPAAAYLDADVSTR